MFEFTRPPVVQAQIDKLPEEWPEHLLRYIERLEEDKRLLDYLASTEQSNAHVMLPTKCVEANPESMRNAILCAMSLSCVRGDQMKDSHND
ncbi:hypothetical protein CA267_002000 [Alteromonas pelagimontana]|uniref:Uncharacterized protein n=1 Tax=Alteromonas pelagimontana TaxID=1858656 RepID=A0A6M4MBY6_9ALTE|nr:hypothetical protein [Alteromonas pelagimontana]QJR79656.1 hypothetical protein CA267_002000 [Alteromonas pelagimontana]